MCPQALARSIKEQSRMTPEGLVAFDDDYFYFSGETEIFQSGLELSAS